MQPLRNRLSGCIPTPHMLSDDGRTLLLTPQGQHFATVPTAFSREQPHFSAYEPIPLYICQLLTVHFRRLHCRQLLDLLKDMHSAKFIHRDVTFNNILEYNGGVGQQKKNKKNKKSREQDDKKKRRNKYAISYIIFAPRHLYLNVRYF